MVLQQKRRSASGCAVFGHVSQLDKAAEGDLGKWHYSSSKTLIVGVFLSIIGMFIDKVQKNIRILGGIAMDKWKRSQRMVLLTKALLEQPHHLFSLTEFSDGLQTAKSSLSEDIAIIKETLETTGQGEVVTLAGAAGGVMYLPYESEQRETDLIDKLAQKLSDPSRILPGGFVYMLDIIYDPAISYRLGRIFAKRFSHCRPDYIVTVETKGIPLAAMTALAIDVPLVVIRSDGQVTEGSAMSINYVSGSTHQIGTMSLARRAITPGSRVVIIDDFMKAGSTALGMIELMSEFKVTVDGIGVLISTAKPQKKLVSDYLSLLELVAIDAAEKCIDIRRHGQQRQ